MKTITMKINGISRNVEIDENDRLLDVIREGFHLTGTKEGCGEGECGVCSVLLDGKLVNSCMIMAFQAEDREVITIEGVGQEGELDPIQQAFIDTGAVQCGFCTPGMILSAKALLLKNPNPTNQEIRRGISGNLCRCTGYEKIVEAVALAAKRISEK
ncbi:(2Fe-2S)-binding protein [Isachenkonia alkalipeptolytica]|uniref:(2Fe-2S)-binding protein n=1 Tax=Isachenkonia alkalipeptolytica TaxID=2565777 RepID=A0AA44BE85_9CLOT|nr:(2Fe-2S)-binding protein [Isachenkonia alkalipeptolytica]NBG89054.1 (2Fe-2S)-binding protein [Isachenkonia alkalipeptolytica]